MFRLLRLALFTTALGCNFSGASGNNGGGDEDAGTVDARVDIDAAGADCDPWGQRAFFEPCALGLGGDTQFAHPALEIDENATYNTDDNTFSPDSFGQFDDIKGMVGGRTARILFVDSFSVENPRTFRVVGTLPLVVASLGEVNIRGGLDLASRYLLIDDTTPSFQQAAGQSRPDCQPRPDIAGAGDVDGGGGGAGASFGSRGGSGGAGLGAAGITASADAIPVNEEMTFAGGCRGGSGGSSGNGAQGVGGFGGGAVMLSSVSEVRLRNNSLICAGGAAGYGQTQSDKNGGGGGGSGGMIVLEGQAVVLDGIVAANGGGGGGGAVGDVLNDPDSSNLLAGQNGQCDVQRATGAPGEANTGAVGGDGSSLLDATAGGNAIGGGGGGGGGGAGVILVVAPDFGAVSNDGALISPTPIVIDPSFNVLD